MGTKRFQFNTETLQYEQRSTSWFQRVGRITLKTVLSIGMGFGLMLAYSLVFDTPRTQNLKRSREEMLQQVAMLQDLVQSAASQIGIIERRDNQVYRSYSLLPACIKSAPLAVRSSHQSCFGLCGTKA